MFNLAISEANLVLVFDGEDGRELTLRWRYFKTSTTIEEIKKLVSCVIENGDIFDPIPLRIRDVKYTKVREIVSMS